MASPRHLKAEIGLPNPDEAQVESPAPRRASPDGVHFEDRPMMIAGSIAFGLSIPALTALYGKLGPTDPRFWIGQAGYVALALAIWSGNRWLLFHQRRHFDWFSQPWRKLALLVAANVLYTAPITALGLWLCAQAMAQPLERQTLALVVLINVICVLFVTHAYETFFLIRERESDLMQVERLERAQAQSELAALKAQLDPHFLFNSLNTLGHLITHDAARAREFCDALARIYRYVLASRESDLVPLAEEMDFVAQYWHLLQLRFGQGVQLQIGPQLAGATKDAGDWLVPPLAVQALLENAVKHNQAGLEIPMLLSLEMREGRVCASNRRRARTSALPTSGRGLANLDERCRLLTGQALVVRQTAELFEVELPLVAARR